MQKKLIPIALLVIALAAGGILLMTQGKDAVTMASLEKNSLLTADTVNTSFQGVGGRVVSIPVAEEQMVKAGDVLMALDQADIDLQISKLQTDIKQQEVKIQQAINQVTRPEDHQRQILAVESAQKALDLVQINYDRSKALFDSGVLAQAAMDTISNQLELAKNTVSQQRTLANKLGAQVDTDGRNYAFTIDLLQTQKESLGIQLQGLALQKQRSVLRAPSSGKITRIIPKAGENIAAGAVAVMIQSDQLYYNLYVDETQVSQFKAAGTVSGYLPALRKNLTGTVHTISSAPQYASMRMSREKGQADTSVFLIRVDVPVSQDLLPGMTVEVNTVEGNK